MKDLTSFLEIWKTRRFSWGRHDCVHFIADYVEFCTGVAVLIPPYKTEREALKVLVRVYSGSFGDSVGDYLGPKKTKNYSVGDIVLSMRPVQDTQRTGPGLGIIKSLKGSKGIAVFVGRNGLEEVTDDCWLYGWGLPGP